MLLSLIYLPKVTGHLLHYVILISFEMNVQQETSSIYELVYGQWKAEGQFSDSGRTNIQDDVLQTVSKVTGCEPGIYK